MERVDRQQEMSLIQRIMNSQALTALYENDAPLNGAEIAEIQLRGDEPRLSVRIMSTKKPLSPPIRWPMDLYSKSSKTIPWLEEPRM